MKLIKIIYNDIKTGQNIDTYLALLLGVFCSFIGIFDVGTKYVFTAISTVLTLLAFGTLLDRINARKLSQLLEEITSNSSDVFSIRNSDSFYSNISEAVNGANNEICLLVRSGGTIKYIFENIREALNRGCRVRVILCARNQTTIDAMAFRGYNTTQPEEIRKEIERSIQTLKTLKEKIELPQRRLLETREIKYLPPVGLSITDPELPSGKLFALLVSFRSHSRSGPSIKLDKKSYPGLFSYFQSEFNNYWNAADEITELIN